MSVTLQYPHLILAADGNARIEGTRYEVIHLAGEHYHYGWSAEEILRQHPELRPEQVYAALTYFYDHHEQLVAMMLEITDLAQKKRSEQALSRAELLRRLEARST